jgi:hypothetical protein
MRKPTYGLIMTTVVMGRPTPLSMTRIMQTDLYGVAVRMRVITRDASLQNIRRR